jgi:lipopolysaccharide transport system permease protein
LECTPYVFFLVFEIRWALPVGGQGAFALLLFSGMILFNLFSECVNRAPGLLLEHVTYIKKVVFPLENLPLVLFTLGVVWFISSGGIFLRDIGPFMAW